MAGSISNGRYWLFEIIAILVSIFSLTGIVALLAIYDGAPVFRWHHLTLNTSVSILSTTIKAALLFAVAESISQWKWILFSRTERRLIEFEAIDRASRGPYGSFNVLYGLKDAKLLWIGAAMTVISLGVDPFVQQLVRFEIKPRYQSNDQAIIGRAQRYSKGNEFRMQLTGLNFTDGTGAGDAAVYATADFSMQSAMLFGFNQPISTVVQQTPFHCLSGNCTWDPFDSLAVCSVCNDLTGLLKRTEINGAALAADLELDNGAATSNIGVQFEVPNGLYINNINGWRYGSSFDGNIAAAVFMTTYGTGNRTKTNTLQDLDTLIWGTSILRVQPASDNASAAWPYLPVEALECGLYYCVNNYEFNITNGTLYENVSPVKSAARSPQSWHTESPVNSSFATSLEFDKFSSYAKRTDLMLGDDFNISQPAVDGISWSIRNLMTMDARFSFTRYNLTGWYMSDGNTQYQPSAMEALFSSEDLNGTFQSISRSMTNAIITPYGNDSTVKGKSGTQVTHYKVQWPWIALPAIFVVGGSTFLLLTIYESNTMQCTPYKSSALMVLANGLYVADTFLNQTSQKVIEKIAKHERMRFPDRARDSQSSSQIHLSTIDAQIGLHGSLEENPIRIEEPIL